MIIVKVAILSNSRLDSLDYKASVITLMPGTRVLVPLANKIKVGVVVEVDVDSDYDLNKIKNIEKVIDHSPLWDLDHQKFLNWAASYYHAPIAKILVNTIPKFLKRDKALLLDNFSDEKCYTLADDFTDKLNSRSKKQSALVKVLKSSCVMSIKSLIETGYSKDFIKKNVANGLLIHCQPHNETKASHKVFSAEQSAAFDKLTMGCFNALLLDGVTGSGKTELYLQWIDKCIELGKSAMILLPEIGLTPQMLARVEQRFSSVYSLHSDISDQKRARIWLEVSRNDQVILIGTRSSVWVPIKNLGLIIVDEEHDDSFSEQHTSVRYSARDLAVLRAKFLNIPVVLASATPSFESYHQVKLGKYNEAVLYNRVSSLPLPHIHLVSMKGKKTLFAMQCYLR